MKPEELGLDGLLGELAAKSLQRSPEGASTREARAAWPLFYAEWALKEVQKLAQSGSAGATAAQLIKLATYADERCVPVYASILVGESPPEIKAAARSSLLLILRAAAQQVAPMPYPVKTVVVAEVESVTPTDAIVAFDHAQLGWYSLTIPCGQFPTSPTVGSRVQVDMWVNGNNEIVHFGVRPNAEIQPPSAAPPEAGQSSMPPEPEDYDDPGQVEEYHKKLRQFFHRE